MIFLQKYGIILQTIRGALMENKEKTSWTDKDADNTYLIMGGLLLAHIIVCCIFAVIFVDSDETQLISPEIMMAIVNLPIAIISFAAGKKLGAMQSGNGNTNNTNNRSNK